MPQLYDWAADTQSGMQEAAPPAQPLPVADWVNTTNSWDPTRSDARRTAQVERAQQRQVAGVNPVNGHALDCECSRCPGWYAARARLAAESLANPLNTTGPATPPERAARPLQDQVIPVAVLMTVFTICAVVLLPVVVPLIALTAMSLALITVSLITVVVAMLGFMVFVMRARREVGSAPSRSSRQTVVGKIVGRS